MMIKLNPSAIYKLPIKNGYLDIRVASDSDYPGLDVEYIDDRESDEDAHTRPRVLIECPKDDNRLRCLVWGDPASEDYSEAIDFETASDRLRESEKSIRLDGGQYRIGQYSIAGNFDDGYSIWETAKGEDSETLFADVSFEKCVNWCIKH